MARVTRPISNYLRNPLFLSLSSNPSLAYPLYFLSISGNICRSSRWQVKGPTFVSTYDDSIDGIQMDGSRGEARRGASRSCLAQASLFRRQTSPLQVEIFNASWKRVRLYFTLRSRIIGRRQVRTPGITGAVRVITRAPII